MNLFYWMCIFLFKVNEILILLLNRNCCNKRFKNFERGRRISFKENLRLQNVIKKNSYIICFYVILKIECLFQNWPNRPKICIANENFKKWNHNLCQIEFWSKVRLKETLEAPSQITHAGTKQITCIFITSCCLFGKYLFCYFYYFYY